MIGREVTDVTLVTQSRVPLYGMHQTLWSCLVQHLKNPELSHETYHKRMGTRLIANHCDTISGMCCNVNHVPKRRVLKSLDWLYIKAIKPFLHQMYEDIYCPAHCCHLDHHCGGCGIMVVAVDGGGGG